MSRTAAEKRSRSPSATTLPAPKKRKSSSRPRTASPSAPASDKRRADRPKRKRRKSTVLLEAEEAANVSPALDSCKSVLNAVGRHQYAFPFMRPVDPVALNIPDYFKIITHPMDFGTMRKKLTAGEYTDLDHFCADAYLVFNNALNYNHPGSDVYVMAETLRAFFEKKIRPVEERERKHRQKVAAGGPEAASIPSPRPAGDALPNGAAPTVVRFTTQVAPMTKGEVRQLSADISGLTAKQRDGLIQVLQRCDPSLPQEGEMEVNLATLENSTLRQLEAYVQQQVGTKKKSRSKRKVGLGLAMRRSPEATEKEIDAIQRQISLLQAPPPLSQESQDGAPASEPSSSAPAEEGESEGSSDSESGSCTDSDTDVGSE